MELGTPLLLSTVLTELLLVVLLVVELLLVTLFMTVPPADEAGPLEPDELLGEGGGDWRGAGCQAGAGPRYGGGVLPLLGGGGAPGLGAGGGGGAEGPFQIGV